MDFRDQSQDTTFGGRCLDPEPTCQPVELYDYQSINHGGKEPYRYDFLSLMCISLKEFFSHMENYISAKQGAETTKTNIQD